VAFPPSPIPLVSRRSFLAGSLLGAAALGLSACADKATAKDKLAANAVLPTTVNSTTELAISIHTTQIQLQTSGQIGKLPFHVKDWVNLSAGPDIIQGFRAKSIDLANNAGIPPIQAHAINYDAKIVAVQTVPKPIYTFAAIPGANINTLADLKGKRIGFSQGQAQGVVVLRTLKELGLSNSDVKLVPLTSNQFLTALQGKQIDVAPLWEPVLTKYLGEYGKDGAKSIAMNAVDYLSVLWAPSAVLQDPAKAAAVRAFIPFWTNGLVWAWENKDAWVDAYYVKDQQVTKDAGDRIVAVTPKPVFPRSWDRAIAWEQETADLLHAGGFVPQVKAADLFDRRFEGIAADAVPESYRE
jgi:sulfonate transport system substrate-binding protein